LIFDIESIRSFLSGGLNLIFFKGPGGTVIHNLLHTYIHPSFVKTSTKLLLSWFSKNAPFGQVGLADSYALGSDCSKSTMILE
jgi:hypothetical protein